ncbi:hypothetical protein B0H10DRAFT_1939476 [Mycena sp. CBHHK59/15]|nr:hypothetical protein B0H10DRAFT_1939476 [Mycena sp. CBHHK59/15]
MYNYSITTYDNKHTTCLFSTAVSCLRGRPPKNVPPPPDDAVPSTFELLAHVLQLDKISWTSHHKQKVSKQEPLKFGPVDIKYTIDWMVFLSQTAELVIMPVESLIITSFEWHFLKPASSPWLPLNSDNALQSMLKQARAKVGKKDLCYVILRMKPPSQIQPVVPWAATADRILGIAHDPTEPDEDVVSDDGHGPMQKKAHLDDELEDHVESLRQNMAVCRIGPDSLMIWNLRPVLHTKLSCIHSSSPPLPDCGVHDFCVEYNLGLDAETGLEKLEFQIGDDLEGLPEAEWKKVGFSHLAWKRVLGAYAKYKRHAKRI